MNKIWCQCLIMEKWDGHARSVIRTIVRTPGDARRILEAYVKLDRAIERADALEARLWRTWGERPRKKWRNLPSAARRKIRAADSARLKADEKFSALCSLCGVVIRCGDGSYWGNEVAGALRTFARIRRLAGPELSVAMARTQFTTAAGWETIYAAS